MRSLSARELQILSISASGLCMCEPAEYTLNSMNKSVNVNKSRVLSVFMNLEDRFRESSHVGYRCVQTGKKSLQKSPSAVPCLK